MNMTPDNDHLYGGKKVINAVTRVLYFKPQIRTETEFLEDFVGNEVTVQKVLEGEKKGFYEFRMSLVPTTKVEIPRDTSNAGSASKKPRSSGRTKTKG